ncbi:Protein hgh1 [Malassezia cuniculi]|uniref:Protein HGH1 homolog n=1 Tax=Malassezia cuniculi TaxID=948313 RepID=A0AAF0ER00_9BASI|nr:Protein hgh1 [Malassezia cuniculi]
MSLTPEVELLTFLADPNPQVRKEAISAIVSFSAKENPKRRLLLDPLKDSNGQPVRGRDGEPLDVLERLKDMCSDQPLAAHDAFSMLVNLSDSPLPALKIGSVDFLQFLVAYIGDSVSLLADLACMLLSNLTKYEPVVTRLLDAKVSDRPFYSFFSPTDLQLSMKGLDADPSAPDYEEQRAKVTEAAARLAKSMQQPEAKEVPAMYKLIRAFEEGATVETSASSGANMRERAEAQKAEAGAKPLEVDGQGRPHVRRRSDCNFLASVFANVSVIPRGREFFVQPFEDADPAFGDSYPVGRIMVYTEHASLIRRGGIISALKNILFIKNKHQLLLAPSENCAHEVIAGAPARQERPHSPLDVLPYILLPLIDGKELSKVDIEDQEALPEACQLIDEDKPREKDPSLRLMLVECLLLLCTSLYGRQCLRTRGVYVVVREAHLAEDREEISEAVVRLVNLLKRDESEDTMRDGGDDHGDVDVGAEENDDDDEEMAVEVL